MREFTLENVLNYIDEAIERQKFEGTWLDDQYNKHTTDVGYVCEGLEIMKHELIRTFAKMDIDVNFDAKMLERKHVYQVGNSLVYFDSEGKINQLAQSPSSENEGSKITITPEKLKQFSDKMKECAQ